GDHSRTWAEVGALRTHSRPRTLAPPQTRARARDAGSACGARPLETVDGLEVVVRSAPPGGLHPAGGERPRGQAIGAALRTHSRPRTLAPPQTRARAR